MEEALSALSECCAQRNDYENDRMLRKWLKPHVDRSSPPAMLVPGEQRERCCGPNCAHYMRSLAPEQRQRCSLVRGYKVFVAKQSGRPIGAKLVPHVVVRAEFAGLVDPTSEPDDREERAGIFKYLFVPCAAACGALTEEAIFGGAPMHEVLAYGPAWYVSLVRADTALIGQLCTESF